MEQHHQEAVHPTEETGDLGDEDEKETWPAVGSPDPQHSLPDFSCIADILNSLPNPSDTISDCDIIANHNSDNEPNNKFGQALVKILTQTKN